MNVCSRILALLFLLNAFLGGCFQPRGDNSEVSGRFAAFIDAEFSGNRHALEGGRLVGLSRTGDSLRYARTRASLSELRTIDTTTLSLDERIDWLLLEASLRRTLKDSSLSIAERMPGRYLTLGSLEWRIGGDRAPDTATWRSVLTDLYDAPQAVSIGKERLSLPPPLWVTLALGTLKRYEEYLDTTFPAVVRAKAPTGMRDSLIAAAENAYTALRSFRIFLSDSLVPGGTDSWATGTDYYNWMLKEYHFLPYDVDGMIARGWEIHEQTKMELRSLAERSGTGMTWKQLVSELKEHHPRPYQVTDAYIRESHRARSIIGSARMIDIPPAETLLFVPTPPALRETYAWGGYGGIAMIDSVMSGRFFVTDIVDGMSDDEVQQKLRTQNDGWITVIALHEGYPGHHLQAVYAKLNPQKVRSRLGSTYFGEGWALYCESWMGRNGFYVDKWDSLGWLNMRLWRTARVILDPSLHAGLMSYDEAVSFFMDEVGLERSAAEAEVNRYTTWPTQAPSYIIGWLEIERLKKSMQQRMGEDFSEKHFAEALLRTGSLPPALLERVMLGTWRGATIAPAGLSFTD